MTSQRIIPVHHVSPRELLGQGVRILLRRAQPPAPPVDPAPGPATPPPGTGSDLVAILARQTGASPESVRDEIAQVW